VFFSERQADNVQQNASAPRAAADAANFFIVGVSL
jgi:hypothetical protein